MLFILMSEEKPLQKSSVNKCRKIDFLNLCTKAPD